MHRTDLCIVGGGLSGVCAAIAAARRGARVVLMHDRPVLGGNCSSEIRMWVCGAHGDNMKETGILEEIQLENLRRNPAMHYQLWDSVLFEKVKAEKNITLLLNCSCNDASMRENRIESVKGWQGTAETWHTVHAAYFMDCSGDSVLAPLTGALHRAGREAGSEFQESIPPGAADKKTMGMSCLFQIRETDRPQKFIPPDWAYVYQTDEDLPFKGHSLNTNFWWIELGGDRDSIHDTEELRDELLKIALGVWDHIKNRGGHGAERYVLEWLGFLPGKRESRRYIGDYIMTQNDVEAEGRFPDTVAYGGWSMDDHFPEGFYYTAGHPTIYHPAPSPYGIPYRCLYSANIENLFFAGRNISVTHAALSSTRVMATCALLGQAAGTAAAIAVREGVSPRGVYESHTGALQAMLMEDDCWLPWHTQQISEVMKAARIEAGGSGAENLRNGADRVIGEDENAWRCRAGDEVCFFFDGERQIRRVRLVFDSDLNDRKKMPARYPLGEYHAALPPCLVKEYVLEARTGSAWQILAHETNNCRRLQKYAVDVCADALRLRVIASHGAQEFRVFSVYAE
jgi:hypothetical protein